jgi:hypothetical protein
MDNTTGTVKEARIRSIRLEEKQGAFNPITLHGTLLVNGILASSFSRVFGLPHEAFQPIGIPFRCWYYVAKYIGIYPPFSTVDNDLHWSGTVFIYFMHLKESICSTSKIIYIIVTSHLLYFIYKLITIKWNQSTNLMNWKNLYSLYWHLSSLWINQKSILAFFSIQNILLCIWHCSYGERCDGTRRNLCSLFHFIAFTLIHVYNFFCRILLLCIS